MKASVAITVTIVALVPIGRNSAAQKSRGSRDTVINCPAIGICLNGRSERVIFFPLIPFMARFWL